MKGQKAKKYLIIVLILMAFFLFVACTSQKDLRNKLKAEGYTEAIFGGDSASQDGTWKIKRVNKSISDFNVIEIVKCKTHNGAREFEAYKKYELNKSSKYKVVRKGKIVYIGRESLIKKILK